MNLSFLCALLSLFMGSLRAEPTLVKGEVINAKTKVAVPYVTISFKRANTSSVSNSEGKFFLRVENGLTDTLLFSCIGYKPKVVAVKDMLRPTHPVFTILLEEETFAIKQVLISRLSARQVIEKAIAKISSESEKEVKLEGFYRRAIKEDSQFVALTEALVNITETGSTSADKLKVSYLKARSSNNYRKFTPDVEPDFVTSALELDHARYQRGFLNKHNLDFWEFEFLDFTKLNGKEVYVVYAKVLDAQKQPTHQAKLYIQSDDYSVLRIEYDYVWNTKSVGGEQFNNKALIQKKYAWRGTFGYRPTKGQMVLSYFYFTTHHDVYSRGEFRVLTKVASQELHEELVISGVESARSTSTNTGAAANATSLQGAVPYDEQFWSTYKSPEDSRLFIQAKMDLEKHAPLKDQYKRPLPVTNSIPASPAK